MNTSFNRYTPKMIAALKEQSVLSLFANALTRGIAFTAMIQLITFLSGLELSTTVELIALCLIFSIVVVSFDVIEKYSVINHFRRKTRH